MVRPFSAASLLVALAAVASFTAACSNTTSPSTAPTFTKTDIRDGSGAAAATGNTLTVNYTGWLYDATKPEQKGLVFDTSLGRSAFTFVLGGQQVIAGWDQGLVGMKVGGLRRLIVPPSMAYGSTRVSRIPPDATLVFEVELLDVK
ncbi:MAG: FKBP-type peptidyl-prolyl cis-trans isomerase [Bacteroidales bacterium]